MHCKTKDQIMETALKLFSQNGFPGTSMSDIASQVGITKGALYKHYESKQEILEQILKRMAELDQERAKKYGMPESSTEDFTEAYMKTPAEKIREYSIAQFRHWTEEKFCAQFRRMLTLEQYRSREMSKLYQKHLASGPLEYISAVFGNMTNSTAEAKQLALEFYGPIFTLFSVYDGAAIKKRSEVLAMLEGHIESFIERLEKRRAETNANPHSSGADNI